MSLHINLAGTWTEVQKLHINLGGVWTPVQKGFVNIAGVWTQYFSADVQTPTDYTGYYEFEDINASSYIKNEVGNIYDTLTHECQTVGGKFERAIDSLVPFQNGWFIPVQTTVGTISVWVKVDLLGTAQTYIQGKNTAITAFDLKLHLGRFVLDCRFAGGEVVDHDLTDDLTDGEWNFISIKAETTNEFTLCVNGNIYKIAGSGAPFVVNDSVTYVCRNGIGFDQLLHFDRILSDEEVLLLFNNGNGLPRR